MVMGDRIKPSVKKAEGKVKRAAGEATDKKVSRLKATPTRRRPR